MLGLVQETALFGAFYSSYNTLFVDCICLSIKYSTKDSIFEQKFHCIGICKRLYHMPNLLFKYRMYSRLHNYYPYADNCMSEQTQADSDVQII